MIKPTFKPKASLQGVLDTVYNVKNAGIALVKFDLALKHDLPVVVAIRGYYMVSMGDPSKNDRGVYDDALFILSNSSFASFNANTDPSVKYKTGVATLVAPQLIRYTKGYHGYGRSTGHPAFRQASDVIVSRDGGRGNGTPLGDGLFKDSSKDRFWTNLHKGGYRQTSSAGCITVYPAQWDAFYALLCLELKAANTNSFDCFLVNDPRI